MADTITFGVKLTSSGGQAVAGEIRLPKKALNDLTGSEQRAGNQADKTNKQFAGLGAQSKKLWETNQRLSKSLFSLKGAFASLGVGLLVRDVVKASLALERSQAVMKALTGSSALAAKELRFVASEADRLGRSNANLRLQYAGLMAATRGTRLEGQATRELFSALNETATVLGLTTDQNTRVMLAFQQIISKGRVSAEELRQQLGESLPGAFQIAARAMGVTTAELDRMLEAGELLSNDFIPKFTKQIRDELGEGVADAAQTSLASFNRLGNSIEGLQVAVGNSGLIDWLKEAADFTSEKLVPAFQLLAVQMGLLTPNIDSLTKDAAFALLAAKRDRQEVLREKVVALSRLNLQDKGAITEFREGAALIKQLEKRLILLAKAEGNAAAEADNLGLSIGHLRGQTDEQAKSAQKYLDKLTEQANTVGLSAEQLAAYQLEMLGADEATINHARGLVRHTEKQKEAQKADKKRADTLARQAQAVDKAKKSDQALIAALKDELALMRLSEREREIEIELRKLSAEATAEQRQQVRELAAAQFDANEVANQAGEEAKNFEKSWDRSLERVDDLFVDLWRGALDGANNFGDTLKDWFKGLLAELAHQALTRSIAIQFAGAFGGGGGGAGGFVQQLTGGGGVGGGGGLSLTSLAGLPFNLAGDALRGLAGVAGGAGLLGTQRTLMSGVTGLNNANPFTAGIGGFLGNFGANSLLGGDRGIGANVGGTIGTALGTAFIPIPGVGSAIGGFLGNAVGGLFGSSPSPPKFHVRGSANPFSPSTDNDGWARSVEAFGALGGIQFSAQHIGDNNSFLENQGFVDALAGVDNLIANTIDERFLAAAQQRAQSFELHSKGGVSGEAIFGWRAQRIAESLLPGLTAGQGGSFTSPPTIEGLVGGILVKDNNVQRAGEDLAQLDAAIARFGRTVVESTIDIAGYHNSDLTQFFDDVSLVGLLSPAVDGLTATANLLAEGIGAIDEQFAALADRATELGLPLDRLNDLRDAEKRQLEQTLGLGGVRDLLNNLTATSNSPLGRNEILNNASDLYRTTISAAASGDQLALNQIPGVANNLIGLLRESFTSSTRFFEGGSTAPYQDAFVGFNQIVDDLNQLLGIPRLALGGVTSGLAFAGDGPGNEAVVPLPNGRSIPVAFSADMVTPVVNALQLSDDRAAANAGGQAEILEDILSELRALNSPGKTEPVPMAMVR